MEDLFKKFLYTGVGLVAFTAEKLQTTVDDLVHDGKLSKSEGKKMLDGLLDSAQAKREDFEESLQSVTEKIIERLNIPSQSDYEALEQRVAALEAKIAAIPKPKTPAKRTTIKKD